MSEMCSGPNLLLIRLWHNWNSNKTLSIKFTVWWDDFCLYFECFFIPWQDMVCAYYNDMLFYLSYSHSLSTLSTLLPILLSTSLPPLFLSDEHTLPLYLFLFFFFSHSLCSTQSIPKNYDLIHLTFLFRLHKMYSMRPDIFYCLYDTTDFYLLYLDATLSVIEIYRCQFFSAQHVLIFHTRGEENVNVCLLV